MFGDVNYGCHVNVETDTMKRDGQRGKEDA
jgi:hypothetical protein